MKQKCNCDTMTADFGDISFSDFVKYSCQVTKMKFNADF